MTHPAYWFFHEYLDEQNRFRVFKNTAETEKEARKMHRQACEYRWVTQHLKPSVSPLFTRGDGKDRTIVPGHREGDVYTTESNPVPMPDYIRQQLKTFRIGDEAALHDVRTTVERPAMHDPHPTPQSREEPSAVDTPF